MDTQNQNPIVPKQPFSKSALAVVGLVIIVLVVIGLWMWKENAKWAETPPAATSAPAESQQAGDSGAATTTAQDSTQAIQQDLEGINSVDLQKEFDQIDADLNSL